MLNQAPHKPVKVIIIDQDNVFLHVMSTMFQGLGWQASGFTEPQLALQSIENDSAQTCLLITAFDPHGSAMQQIIKHAREHFPGMRFLLLGSKPNIVPIALPENTGFLSKPVRPRQLLSAAERLLAEQTGPAC